MLVRDAGPLEVREWLGGAATAHLRKALAGPPCIGRAVHVGRDAVYVEVPGDHDTGPGLVGVLSRHATHVPCGIRTMATGIEGVERNDAVPIGNGMVRLPAQDVVVTRIVDASVPTSPLTKEQVGLLGPGLVDARGVVDAELPPASLEALHRGAPSAVEMLLGRGSGLTPLGDDVLAGWLAAGRGAGVHGWAAVAERVRLLAARRTTLLSRTLLAHAMEGEVIPEFRRLLLDGAAAAEPLLRVGHTSGCGLAVGALLALTEPEGSPR